MAPKFRANYFAPECRSSGGAFIRGDMVYYSATKNFYYTA